MDIASFFTSMPSWALFSLFVIIGVFMTEVGSFFGRRKFNTDKQVPAVSIGTAVTAVLGLLAFMLGFTFSITASRFSDRKGLAISQANAIGTSYLRAGLIPEKQKTEVRKLLKEYTDLLLQVQSSNQVETKLNRLEEIHWLLWEQTVSLENEKMVPAIQSLFISSVNEIINVSDERKTVSLVFRIPNVLWSSLLLLTGMSMFAFGYQSGINGSRRISGFPLLPVAYALVIVLIADMDATSLSRFQVSQEPLKNLQKMMHKNIP
ncbi:hypothetical protein [Adhaeribacter terreus]|uniref:DUF4239 domain-containing protein n=1 Tax=Adhaeribacter terreus TaxID=529703 RepID=A0ABW0EBT7_9BACT